MRSNVARCGDAVPTQAPFWCLQWRPQRQVCLKPAGRLACVPLSCPCAGHLVSTHMQAHTQAGMFSQARARVHASSLARAHTHTRTLTRIHIQTRMHAGRQQAEDLGKVFRLVMYPRCVCASPLLTPVARPQPAPLAGAAFIAYQCCFSHPSHLLTRDAL